MRPSRIIFAKPTVTSATGSAACGLAPLCVEPAQQTQLTQQTRPTQQTKPAQRGLLAVHRWVASPFTFLLATYLFLSAVAVGENPKQSLTPEVGLSAAQPKMRLVSLAPSLTEIVAALGGLKALVGVTSHCDYPPEVQKITKIGDYLTPSLEKVLSLAPTHVIGLAEHKQFLDKLAPLKIAVLVVKNQSIGQIVLSFGEISSFIGRSEQADTLITGVANATSSAKKLKPVTPPKVAIAFGGPDITAMFAAGADTLYSEIVEQCGGVNIFADLSGYSPLSLEPLIQRNPVALILITPHTATPKSAATAPLSVQFPTSIKVLRLDQEFLVNPGARLAAIISTVCDAVRKAASDVRA